MCGIAGIIAAEGHVRRSSLKASVMAMTESLRHRGPDDEGVWYSSGEGVALGFRRLAIIDVTSAGHQPMTSGSGRYVCVFNGEIYNHADIRKALGRDVTLRGHSDTEVMLAAIDRWGLQSAVERFNGMFSIGLWDRQERVLHLIRDRLGIKPLFVYAEPKLVLFASELKSIMKLSGLDLAIDRDSVASFLQRLHIPAPHSIFTRVHKLLPGHILSISGGESISSSQAPYWSLRAAAMRGLGEPLADPNEAIEALNELLLDSVRARLVSDVPLGAFLSGGVDSSLVVALMQELSSRPVKTFAIGFDDQTHNEAEQAAAVADYLGTEHRAFILSESDARNLVPSLPEHFDEPFASSSAIPNLLVCSAATDAVTVALSGVGGDELFHGYNRYTQLERVSALFGLPPRVRRALGVMLGAPRPEVWRRLEGALRPVPALGRVRLLDDKVRKLSRLLPLDNPTDAYRALVSVWSDPTRLVREGKKRSARDDGILLSETDFPKIVDRAVLADQAGYLSDDQLVVADRASMAASLEVRVPLLDHRILELSWRMPASLKSSNRIGKIALRTLLGRRIPRRLFERPKVGFSVPLRSWLNGALREWAGDLLDPRLLRRHDLFDPTYVGNVWNDFLGDSRIGALEIWSLVMFQAWFERWGTSIEQPSQ